MSVLEQNAAVGAAPSTPGGNGSNGNSSGNGTGSNGTDAVQLARRVQGQQALLRLSISHQEFRTSEQLFAEASQMAMELTNAETAVLYARQKANARSGKLSDALRFWPAQQFPHAAEADPAPPDPRWLEEAGIRQAVYLTDCGKHLLVPFQREQKVMAMLVLYRQARPFDFVDGEMMQALVDLVSSILQTQYLITARTALVELAQSLSAELDLGTLLQKVAKAAANIAYAEASSILLIQPREDTMRFASVYGLGEKDREMLRQLVVPLKSSMAGSVALTGKPLVSNDVAKDPRFYAGISDTLDTKTRSLLAVPMIAGDRPIGALEVINQAYDDGFDKSDVEILTLFASQAAVAIENARLLAERQSSLAELQKLEQKKSQFIALASHELRTPLNVVSGYSTLLRGFLDDIHVPPEHESLECLGQIEQATAGLIEMVNNITSMYNLETGRTQLLVEAKDVNQIVQKSMAEYGEWCRKKGLHFEFLPQQPMIAACDPIEIGRVLSNLFNNAVKFTPEGGKITVEVSRSGQPGRQEILVSVADTGSGIDPKQVATIFERFAQIGSHLNRSQGGIGLGLPLAKALVERHGGRMWVESLPGAGANFFFTLPAM